MNKQENVGILVIRIILIIIFFFVSAILVGFFFPKYERFEFFFQSVVCRSVNEAYYLWVLLYIDLALQLSLQ